MKRTRLETCFFSSSIKGSRSLLIHHLQISNCCRSLNVSRYTVRSRLSGRHRRLPYPRVTVPLTVCHGRPLLISTMSTVPSRYHFPTPPSSRLLADTPLNTVTTVSREYCSEGYGSMGYCSQGTVSIALQTSEDRPTTATPEESSTVAHSTTVTPRTVEVRSKRRSPTSRDRVSSEFSACLISTTHSTSKIAWMGIR